MAVAVKTYNLSFPEFVEQASPLVEAKGLYHILLPNPVPYDSNEPCIISLSDRKLSKSTLIKSVGLPYSGAYWYGYLLKMKLPYLTGCSVTLMW
jgi:hypothetical protein